MVARNAWGSNARLSLAAKGGFWHYARFGESGRLVDWGLAGEFSSESGTVGLASRRHWAPPSAETTQFYFAAFRADIRKPQPAVRWMDQIRKNPGWARLCAMAPSPAHREVSFTLTSSCVLRVPVAIVRTVQFGSAEPFLPSLCCIYRGDEQSQRRALVERSNGI